MHPDDTNFIIERADDVSNFYFRHTPVVDFVAYPYPDAELQAEENASLIDRANESQRIWVISIPGQIPDEFASLEEHLAQNFAQCQPLVATPSLWIDQFTLAPICCRDTLSTPVSQYQYGDGIGLVGVDTQTDGVSFFVTGLWTIAEGIPMHQYSVSWQLLNSEGERVAQADYGLEPVALTCQRTTIPVEGLPAGEYRLMATVYNWETLDALPGTVIATGIQSNLLEIQQVSLP
jgi:hypothetical protein